MCESVVEIIGSYELERERDENLQQFLQEIQISPWVRRQMLKSTVTLNVIKEEEKWNFRTVIESEFVFDTNFKLGQDHYEIFFIAGLASCVTTMEGNNKFVTNAKLMQALDPTYTKCCIFDDYGMTMTFQATNGEIVAKRYFKRICREPTPEKSDEDDQAPIWHDVDVDEETTKSLKSRNFCSVFVCL